MLFGARLASGVYAPWKDSYIEYDHLKDLLKEEESRAKPGKKEVWTDKDESAFVEALDKQLQKVYTFQAKKFEGLTEKLNHLEDQTKTQEMINSLHLESFQRILEDSLSEARELDNFSRLNYTGFVKIVKKHDKLHPKYPSVKSLLEVRLRELPINSEEYSPLLHQISFLYNIVRSSSTNESQSLMNSAKLSSVANSNVTNLNFKSMKFWVHKDNLMEVKTRILRHLPVLVYASAPTENDDLVDCLESDVMNDDGALPSSGSSAVGVNTGLRNKSYDPVINTLYFDNEAFELYNNKLLRTSSAPTLRFRWTGKLVDKPDVFLEKRTSFENESDGMMDFEELRLKLPKKYINRFIFSDEDTLKELEIKKLKARGALEDEIEENGNSYDNIQNFIVEEQLQPVLRTVYTRTAFQIPGDDRVRVTIDSDILYIREDSFDAERPIREPNNWHRTDIDLNVANPLKLLRTGEYSQFPYAVMEIKIKDSSDANNFSKSVQNQNLARKHNFWINDLTNSHLVKEVPKFSKFIQGIASLFGDEDKLDVLPFWLPELDTNIKKDPKDAYEEQKKKEEKEKKLQVKLDTIKRYSQNDQSITQSSLIGQKSRASSSRRDASLDDNESSEEEQNEIGSSKQYKIKGNNAKQQENLTFLKILAGKDNQNNDIYSEVNDIELPPGVKKPINLLKNMGPVKVEAKVWLANERTFLRWLKVTTLFSILTFAIYNSVKKAEYPRLADLLAYSYFCLTLFSGIWSYTTYNKRLKIIRQRSGEHLDAPLGPIVVAVVLSITLIVNFVVAFREEARRQSIHASSATFSQTSLPEALKPVQNFIFKLVGANGQ